jgi:DNA topoisomerase-3
VGAGKTCDFRSGKIILQQEVARADMQKLLATGKTDLLKGFISNKTRRKFSAYLVRDAKTGKVGFEFEPRAPKAGAKPAKAIEEKPVKAATKIGVGDTAKTKFQRRLTPDSSALSEAAVAKKAAVKKPEARKPAAKKPAAKPAAKKPAKKKAE